MPLCYGQVGMGVGTLLSTTSSSESLPLITGMLGAKRLGFLGRPFSHHAIKALMYGIRYVRTISWACVDSPFRSSPVIIPTNYDKDGVV